MAEHDPKDVEWMARLDCIGAELDPDATINGYPQWQNEAFIRPARIKLDHLVANGWKVTAQVETTSMRMHWTGESPSVDWFEMHYAAPLTPGEE